MISHYVNDSSSPDWRREMLAMETEARGMCDCCDVRPWKYHGFVCGIETYWCWECAGEKEDEQPEQPEESA